MRPKAEWAIDSEAMRARGIIVLENPIGWSKISREDTTKRALFATSGL